MHVEACTVGLGTILTPRVGGEGERGDGSLLRIGKAAYPAEQRIAVLAWHSDVGEDEIEGLLLDALVRFCRVRRGRDLSFAFA